MLIFWCVLGLAACLLLWLAWRKNGPDGLRRGALLLLAAALLIGLDQAVKFWARTVLQPVGVMPMIPHVLQLRYLLNTGAAFSMLAGKQWFLTVFTGVVLAVMGGYLVLGGPKKRLETAAWLLVLAGGVGNLIDRAARGAVVDLFEPVFINFAVFNVADIFICTGFGLLLLYYLLEEFAARKGRADAAEPEPRAAGAEPARPQTVGDTDEKPETDPKPETKETKGPNETA